MLCFRSEILAAAALITPRRTSRKLKPSIKSREMRNIRSIESDSENDEGPTVEDLEPEGLIVLPVKKQKREAAVPVVVDKQLEKDVDKLLEYVGEEVDEDAEYEVVGKEEPLNNESLKVLSELETMLNDTKLAKVPETLEHLKKCLISETEIQRTMSKKISSMESSAIKRNQVNRGLKKRVDELQGFIKRNRAKLHIPLSSSKVRKVRGTQTRNSDVWNDGNPDFSDDEVAPYIPPIITSEFDTLKKEAKSPSMKRTATASIATDPELRRKKIKKRKVGPVGEDAVEEGEEAEAKVIPCSYTKELPKPTPKRMPGIKPPPAVPSATATVAEVSEEQTTVILPDDVGVSETGGEETETTMTTVVIEETPQGTVIQQAVPSSGIDVGSALAQMKPIQVAGASNTYQTISGIPVKLLQDATTADGQKISIIKINDTSGVAAAAASDGNTIFVQSGPGGELTTTSATGQEDPNTVVVSEVILTTADEMPTAEEILKSIAVQQQQQQQ